MPDAEIACGCRGVARQRRGAVTGARMSGAISQRRAGDAAGGLCRRGARRLARIRRPWPRSSAVDLAAVLRRLASLPQATDAPAVGLVRLRCSGTLTFRKPVDGLRAAAVRRGLSALAALPGAGPADDAGARTESSRPGDDAAIFVTYAIAEPATPGRLRRAAGVRRHDADPARRSGRPRCRRDAPCRSDRAAGSARAPTVPARREPSILATPIGVLTGLRVCAG